MRWTTLLILVFLCGCGSNKKGDENVKIDAFNTPRTEQIPVPPAVTVAPAVDHTKLKDEIRTETTNEIRNTVQHSSDQLTGLVTAKIGQLAESIKGAEINLRELLRVEMNNALTATANLTAKVEAAVTSNIQMQAELKVVSTLNTKIEAQATAIATMNSEIGSLKAQVAANANAIVGFNNSVSNLQAGRDNNALTPEATKLVMAILALVALYMKLEARNEAAERKQLFALVMTILTGDGHDKPEIREHIKAYAPDKKPLP